MYSEIINEVKNKRMTVFCLSVVVSAAVLELRVARNLLLPSFPSVTVWQVHTASWGNLIVLTLSPELWASLTILYSYVSFLYFDRHCFQSRQCKQILLYFPVICNVVLMYFFLSRHLGEL